MDGGNSRSAMAAKAIDTTADKKAKIYNFGIPSPPFVAKSVADISSNTPNESQSQGLRANNVFNINFSKKINNIFSAVLYLANSFLSYNVNLRQIVHNFSNKRNNTVLTLANY